MKAAHPESLRPDISLHRWFWSIIIPLAFIILFLFVRIPVNVFEASPGEHSSSPGEILRWLATGGAATLFVAGAAIFFALRPLRYFVSACLISLALTYWMMDSFFVRGYPQLDGTVMRIETDMVRGLLEIALFATLTAVIVKARGKAHVPALIFLSLLTVANVLWVLRSASIGESVTQSRADTDAANKVFTLSNRGNAVIILLDTFQSDFLPDALGADASLARVFDGFIYFPDTLGEAPSTYLSLPAIHAGRMYDPARTMAGHFDRSIRDSFLVELARAGYRSSLVNPIRQLCPEGVVCATRDDFLRGGRETAVREALHLLDISIMRSAPEFLKNAAFNGGEFHLVPWYSPVNLGGDSQVVYDDAHLLSLFAKRLEVVDDQPRAVFLHLMATHPPYVLNEHCDPRPESSVEMDRHGAILQIRCALGRVASLVTAMRKAGIYENTMLVILGDHGSSSEAAADDLSSRYLETGSYVPSDVARLVGSANPLLMIKPAGSDGPMRTDAREAGLIDVRTTICAALRACTPETGQDLLAPESVSNRQRRFMSYRWEHPFWELGYVPEVNFYNVTGPLNDWTSWHGGEAGIRRTSIGGLTFSDSDDPAAFGEGWGNVERGTGASLSKRWAIAREAVLVLDLNENAGGETSYQLNFEVYTPEFIENQAISLRFNGVLIAKRLAGKGRQTISYRIPLELVHEGPDTVTLVFDTIFPGSSLDERSLAVSFFSLAIERVLRTGPEH